MLDKCLTGENVKVNGEIAGRRHILRTLWRRADILVWWQDFIIIKMFHNIAEYYMLHDFTRYRC
jgi:hypothetical protein